MAIRIALAGNPNCGKTTMFNALTGANQYVGNWPGVTVEKKEGKVKSKRAKGEEVIVTDLPGIYSLSPYTLEEVVSRDYILKENPDVIIDLVDATNIERNLYLTTQLVETGVPVVIALNMADLIAKRGMKIDTKRLSMLLGCPIVETSALKQTGLSELIDEAVKTAKKKEISLPGEIFSKEMESAVEEVKGLLPDSITDDKRRWYAVKFLERDNKVVESVKLPASDASAIEALRDKIEKRHDDDMESIVTDERYKYIQQIVKATVQKGKEKLTTSDKIDRIVTNRILGIPIFIVIMWAVYYVSVTTVGTWVTDWTNDVFVVAIQDAVGGFLGNIGAGTIVTDLVVNGIIGGLGAVLGFVPQMAILFLFLSILEDCGYMVRIAFVMDRVFRHFGLSGKSFIPLLISSGCGIPGIMASKTIEQDNDRRLTIMTATFIPCGAKLPVIALMGGVIAGAAGGYAETSYIAPLMYFIGIAAVLVSAIILKKTKPFSGKPAPFVMELPQYHIPAGEDSPAPCMGEAERLHHQGRYDPVPCVRSDVVPRKLRLWTGRLRLGRVLRQPDCGHRRRDRTALCTARLRRVAAGRRIDLRIYGERGDRIHHGYAGGDRRRCGRPGDSGSGCSGMVPDFHGSLLLPAVQPA